MHSNSTKKILLILGGLASLVTVIGFFWSTPFYKEKKLKIECYTERMLSFGTKVDSLTVQYKGEKIDDVWKLRFVLNNVGMQSIVGSGSSSALLNDRLIIDVDTNYQVISYNVSKNDLDASYQKSENSFTIMFKKWKPNEIMQIEMLMTPVNNNKDYPLISVNERDVTGAKVIFHIVDFAKIEDSSNNLDWLINLKLNYPKFLFKIAKYFGLFVFGMFGLVPIILVVQFVQGKKAYNNWKKRNWKQFLIELDNSQIPEEERQHYKHKPYDVPKEFHEQFTSIPEAPEPENIGMLILALLFIILIFYPFLVYALFAWFNL